MRIVCTLFLVVVICSKKKKKIQQMSSSLQFPLICGVGCVVSLAHYFLKRGSLVASVPTKFSLSGLPYQFVHKKWFVMYPALAVLEGLIVTLKLPGTDVTTTAAATVTMGMVVTIVAQVYAGLIAAQQAARMPRWLPLALIGFVAAPVGASVWPLIALQ